MIERAVNAYATLQRTMAEGAGAAGLAAMLANPERFQGKRVGLVLCGGNIDARILASVMVRELERDDRIASFRITSNDRPGLLGRVASRSASSAPTSSRSPTAGCSSTCRQKAFPSTSLSKHGTDNIHWRCSRPWRPRGSHRSGSNPAACPRPPSERRDRWSTEPTRRP